MFALIFGGLVLLVLIGLHAACIYVGCG